MRHPSLGLSRSIPLTAALVAFYATTAWAQTSGSWNVNASGDWATPGNWAGGVIANGANATADFGFDITATRTISLNTSRTIGHLIFSDNGGAGSSWVVNGTGTLLLSATGGGPVITTHTDAEILAPLAMTTLTKQGAGTLILDQPAFGGSFKVDAGNLQFEGGPPVTGFAGSIVNNGTVTFNRNATFLYSGVMSGTGGFVLASPQVVELQNDNTYSGGTTILAGHLVVGNNSGMPFGSIVGNVTNNGILQFSQNVVNPTFAGMISGTGALIQRSFTDRTLILTANNTYSGVTTITQGQLQLGNGGTAGSIGTGDIINARELIFNRSDTLTISGKISSTGSVRQIGSGMTVLSGSNSYSGATTVTAGVLRADHNLAFGSSTVAIASGARVEISSGVTVNNSINLFGGTLSGAGTINTNITIGNGSTISPGNSPGTLTVANETWASGGNYLWEINDVDAGAGTGWDLINITNQLNITATSGGKFNILVKSLQLDNSPGSVHDFDLFSSYQWTIASAGSGVTGFNPNAFNIDTSQFTNSTGGIFSIALVANDLRLSYTATAVPEPGSCLLATIAAAGGWYARRRRKAAAK